MTSEQGETLQPSSLPELGGSMLVPLFPLTLLVHLGVSLGVGQDPLSLGPSRMSGKARGMSVKEEGGFLPSPAPSDWSLLSTTAAPLPPRQPLTLPGNDVLLTVAMARCHLQSCGEPTTTPAMCCLLSSCPLVTGIVGVYECRMSWAPVPPSHLALIPPRLCINYL